MSENNTVVIVQNNHTNATEFLIIVSQTVFFVLLFLLMKSALIDRRGMMHSYDRIKEEKLQLGALFFAIFVFIAILMIPLESYEFVHFVIPLTYIVIIALIIWEINVAYKKKDSLPIHHTKPSTHIHSPNVVKTFDYPRATTTTTATPTTDTAFDY